VIALHDGVSMAEKVVIYWRDIPSQVMVKRGRAKGKAMLDERFQVAIDRAAMRAGKGDTDSYVEEWRREAATYEDDGSDLNTIAHQEAEALQGQFPDELLEQMIHNQGLRPTA